MNIMGIGAPEIAIIAVIALLVFGPAKLPEVMGQAGKMYRDFRRMSAELSGEFEKTIAEARDLTAGFESELGSMTKEVNSLTNSVKKDLGVKGSSTNKGKSSTSKTGTASRTGTAAKSGSKSTSGKAGSSSSTSKIGGKSTGTKSSSSTSSSTGSKAVTAASKKPVTPVATREDPAADVSLFEPVPIERKARTRRAVPSVIADPTPRTLVASDNGLAADAGDGLVAGSPADDALGRARARRRNAGYARSTA